jgi:hypothetical protein
MHTPATGKITSFFIETAFCLTSIMVIIVRTRNTDRVPGMANVETMSIYPDEIAGEKIMQ